MKSLRIGPWVACALVFAVSSVAEAGNGDIYVFRNKAAGIFPLGPLTADQQGNLYGTTFNGGIPALPKNNCDQDDNGCGVVFKLSPNGSGGWNYSVIYEFKGAPLDGQDPADTLAIDTAGNIYGTTYYGGSALGGTVYELTPNGDGTYAEKALYNFTGDPSGTSLDGYLPSGVILDAAGNLYGITTYGGAFMQRGTAWKLSPNANGGWTEQILHSFGSGTDGQNPRTALLLDAAGNLFGVTTGGGAYNSGIVFELSPSGGGWTEAVVHEFGSPGDGCHPSALLISDGAGNLYSTTGSCAVYGTVFELSPSAGGYTEKIIHYFLNPSSGAYPGPVVFDSHGNLYGVTSQGGQYNYGTIYRLTLSGSHWLESAVHNFTGNQDGAYPMYGVIVGPTGHLYGTAPYGGSASTFSGYGVVFEYQP
jgi:uncharacterized repeat protein (TIGR03803 family)